MVSEDYHMTNGQIKELFKIGKGLDLIKECRSAKIEITVTSFSKYKELKKEGYRTYGINDYVRALLK